MSTPAAPGTGNAGQDAQRRSQSGAVTVDRHSVLSDVLPPIVRALRREPALAITVGYLLVAMAGIFYNVRFYAKFGIPVLTLSQVGDFLVAGIQQPVALLLVVSTLPMCWLFDRVNARSRRRGAAARDQLRARPSPTPWQRLRLHFLEWRIGQRWYTQMTYLAVIFGYGWMFVALYADHRAAEVRSGRAEQVRVWLSGDPGALEPAPGKTWAYLGAVANYIFVFDAATARTVILPVENVARLEPVVAPGDKAVDGPIVVPIP